MPNEITKHRKKSVMFLTSLNEPRSDERESVCILSASISVSIASFVLKSNASFGGNSQPSDLSRAWWQPSSENAEGSGGVWQGGQGLNPMQETHTKGSCFPPKLAFCLLWALPECASGGTLNTRRERCFRLVRIGKLPLSF